MTRGIGRTLALGTQMLVASWIIHSLAGKPLFYWFALCLSAVLIVLGAIEEFTKSTT